MSEKRAKVSRRNFMKGVGLAAASVGVVGCNETNPLPWNAATPTATPIPIVNQYPQAPYTPLEPPATGVLHVLTPHEAHTVEALTARILPGTPDDPGAREAGVVYYIDNMLAFNEGFNEATYRDPPYAQVYTGDQPPVAQGATVQSQSGPRETPTPAPTSSAQPTPTPTLTPPPPNASAVTSTEPITGTAVITETQATAPTQAEGATAYQIIWVPAAEIARYGYQSILSPREVYRIGIAAVDRYTNSQFGKDFIELNEEQQDQVIGNMADGKISAGDFDKNLPADSFFHNLRRHTSEGMFSDPVYGGNRNLVGWQLVGYPGAQRAYQPAEFQQEGTARQPQSIMQMRAFNPGQPVNPHVVLPVSGSDEQQR
ncbi:MAG: gluconate 2-dehydrogenase subunit 3 family protein [Caldilineaceae bacterium]